MSGSRPWVIRNPGCDSDGVEEAILVLDPAEVFEPGDQEEWDEVGRRIRKESPEWIVAVGGDGTVQRVVRLIGADSDHALGILPGGTGNDFARALQLPLDLGEAARGLNEGEDRSVDLMEVSLDGGEAELVINAVTVGLSGVVHTALTDEMKGRWGRFAYLRAAVAAATDLEPFEVELRQQGGEVAKSAWSDRLLHISIANGSTAGGGVLIAPNAEVDDGRIDVCAVAEARWSRITAGIPEVLRGSEPDESPWILSAPTRVELTLGAAREVSVDGEVSMTSRIGARILPGALRVRMPNPPPGMFASLLGDDASDDR